MVVIIFILMEPCGGCIIFHHGHRLVQREDVVVEDRRVIIYGTYHQMRRHNKGRSSVVRNRNDLILSMWWWLTHSLKVGALNVTYGGVTQVVVVVVALLTWELGQLVIYGASGEVTLTLNMVAQVTQVIICRRGRRENHMLNHLVVIIADEGRRWHIIASPP